MRCLRTVPRHHYSKNSGKHLPRCWLLFVNHTPTKNLQEIFDVQRRGMESHFFSYMSRYQILKQSTCCPRQQGWTPSFYMAKQEERTWDSPFHLILFFVTFFQFWISAREHFLALAQGPFCLCPPGKCRLYSRPYNLCCEWCWLYLAAWSMAKINKSCGSTLRPSREICYH